LLVVGSVALDSLQGGRIREELGGSAVYFSLAASLLGPVSVAAPVGRDGVHIVGPVIEGRGSTIDHTGLEIVEAPTYRWFAEAGDGHNIDLGSHDSIYDHWQPRLPASYRDWAYCGSMRPDRQLEAARSLTGCGRLAADAMRSYVESEPNQARAVLALSAWYFANEEELAALGARDPESFRQQCNLEGLVVKRGRAGATVYTNQGFHHESAMFDPPALDTTGAGDCLAGAMLARWRQLGGGHDCLPESLRWGVAAATIGISDIGVRAIARATRDDLERLVARGR
jgi:sugar/nucleoside kinase (ribokinase family)